jgi:hypothetical protein
MSSHYILRCSVCNKIIEQCRCYDPNKRTIYGKCNACKALDGEPPGAPENAELAKAPTGPPPTVASGPPTAEHMNDFAMNHYTSRCKSCGQVRLISTSDGVCGDCVRKSSGADLKAQVYDLSMRRTASLQTDPALRLAEKLVAVITANTDTNDAVDHLIALELAGRAVMETIKHGRGETWLNACIVDASRRIQAYEIKWPEDQSRTIYDEKEPVEEKGCPVLQFPLPPPSPDNPIAKGLEEYVKPGVEVQTVFQFPYKPEKT